MNERGFRKPSARKQKTLTIYILSNVRIYWCFSRICNISMFSVSYSLRFFRLSVEFYTFFSLYSCVGLRVICFPAGNYRSIWAQMDEAFTFQQASHSCLYYKFINHYLHSLTLYLGLGFDVRNAYKTCT